MDQGDAGHRYVQKMRDEGYTEHDIREALQDAGWTEEHIEAALATDADGAPPAPPPRERPQAQQPRREPVRPKPSDGSNIWVCVVVGCLGMLLIVGVVAAAIMVPTYTGAREKARQASCLANLKQIDLAANMYAQDYNGLLPPSGGWPDRLYPYIKNAAVFTCPSDQRASGPALQGRQIGYTMNGATGGLNINTIGNPSAVTIHFDGLSLVGGVGDAAFRHNDGANAVYVDGHAKWIDRGSWSSQWTAPSISPGAAPGAPSQPSGPATRAPTRPRPLPSDEPPPTDTMEGVRAGACLRQQKQIATALTMYTTDWDGTAPPARVWPEGIDPYLGGNPESRELHVCPSDANTHASEFEGWDLSYTMNEALGQQRIRERPEPGHDVMVFDGNAVSGGQGAADFRHDGSLYVSYADGHVSRVAQEDWTAQWDQPNNTEETR